MDYYFLRTSLKSGNTLDYLVHRLFDHDLFTSGEMDDSLGNGLKDLDQIRIDDQFAAVQSGHVNHFSFDLDQAEGIAPPRLYQV